MAVPFGHIVVADREAFGGSGGLIAVNPGTGQQQTVAQGGMLKDPAGLAVAADGTIFVADLEAFGSGGIIAVDPDNGQQSQISASTVLTRPMGLAIAADGQLVVAYLNAGDGAGKIMRVNPANAEHHAVAPTTPLVTPADVVVESSGTILVADADIQGFDSRLRRVHADGSVVDIAKDKPGGAIYVGIALSGNDCIVVSAGHGNFKHLVRFRPGAEHQVFSSNGLLKSPFGVLVEPSGQIVVADASSGVVRVDPGNGAQTLLAADGSLEHPIAVALAR